MGNVVYSAFSAPVSSTPLNAPMRKLVLDEFLTSGERFGGLIDDTDVLELAEKVGTVFDSPVIGIDIIRSSKSGKLYILEANMGNVWHFSSKLGEAIRERIGVETMRNQHDVFSKVASAIIKRAKLELAIG